MGYELIHYDLPDGSIPMEGFLDELPPKLRAKVVFDEHVLEEEGPSLREPKTKPLGDGLFELRTKLAGDIVRSLFFFYVGKRIVVTHGFVKKTAKTPRSEIERARRYREDWIRRHGNE